MFDPTVKDDNFQRVVKWRKRWFQLWMPFHRVSAQRGQKLANKIIGITGSVGKTTATHMLAEMLQPYGSVTVGIGTNTEYMVLRTLRKLRVPQDFVVQEVSGHLPGNIARVATAVRFDGCIVTTVGTDHWTAFRDIEAIAREKAQLPRAVLKEGFVCLNADDPRVAAMSADAQAPVITFGLSEGATVRATNIKTAWPGRLSFTLATGDQRFPVITRLVTSIYLPSILGPLAAVHAMGLEMAPAIERLAKIEPVSNRFQPRETPIGHTVLLDTVKASYWSTDIVFGYLKELAAPNLVVVMGEISDTRNDSSRRYRQLLRKAENSGALVIGVGPSAGQAEKLAATEGGRYKGFSRREDAAAFLITLPPSLILLKGADHFNLNPIYDALAAAPKAA